MVVINHYILLFIFFIFHFICAFGKLIRITRCIKKHPRAVRRDYVVIRPFRPALGVG